MPKAIIKDAHHNLYGIDEFITLNDFDGLENGMIVDIEIMDNGLVIYQHSDGVHNNHTTLEPCEYELVEG